MVEDQEVRTTWRMPKSLIKQLKQYALDHETTLTAIAMEIFQELLLRKIKTINHRLYYGPTNNFTNCVGYRSLSH